MRPSNLKWLCRGDWQDTDWYRLEDARCFMFRVGEFACMGSYPAMILRQRRPTLSQWVSIDFDKQDDIWRYLSNTNFETRQLLIAFLATWRTGLLRGQDRFVVQLIAKFVWAMRFTLGPLDPPWSESPQ